MTERYCITVCVKPADDVPGQWIAHCLDIDVVTHGNSRDHAVAMLFEALAIFADAEMMAGRSVADRLGLSRRIAVDSAGVHRDEDPVDRAFADAPICYDEQISDEERAAMAEGAAGSVDGATVAAEIRARAEAEGALEEYEAIMRRELKNG